MRTIGLFFFSFLLIGAENIEFSLSGCIKDENQAPVPSATLRLEPGGQVALADAAGCFKLTGLPQGKITLTVTAKGFFSGTRTELDLTAQPDSAVDVTLRRESVLEQSVVVTGSGAQALLVEAPVRTELVSHKIVEQQAVRNLSEALTATVPGVRIENNCQNCGWTAVRLNGLEGPYTQLLEDGQPTVSGASMVYALDQLPTEFYENVEVVKGGASALYGPNAVAGVINMVRREPHENHFSVDAGYGSYHWRPELTGGLSGQLANIGKDWAADFYYRGYHRTHVDMDGDGFTELTRRASNGGGGTLFRRFFEGAARLTIGGSGLSDFRRGGDQLDKRPEYSYITEQVRSERMAAFARWNHSVSPTFYYNVSSSFSRLARHSYYGAGMDPNAYGETRNPLSTNDASAGWQRGRHTLSVGGQFWWERISDIYPGYGRDTRQTFRNSGVYVQDEWRVAPRLVLLGGARFDKSNVLDHWVTSPRGNVRIGLTNAWNLRVGFSTGFRPPQIFDEDLHIAAVNGEAMYIRLATGLKEESSRSFTSALDYTGRVRNGAFQAGASFFWTRLNDVFQLAEISRDAAGNRVMERTNGPGSRFRGVEFSSSWKASRHVALRGGLTLQQSRYDVPEPNFNSLRYFRSPNSYGFAGLDLTLPHKIEWLHSFDYTGRMLVPHYAGYIPADRLETSPRFGVWGTLVARTWRLGDNDHHTLRTYFKFNNVNNSFQKDFDRGPHRDSVYMYGPLTPRSAVLGCTLNF